MTRTELVKKLTSYASVDESYAASFMESFLLLLHQRLLKAESFELPIKISFSQKKIIRNGKEFYLISCSSTDPFETQSEDLVFAVPGLHDESKKDKYSVFSIGIGKQIIPNKEMISSGFAFEPSFSLKNYCREKAATLIEKGEFVSAESPISDFAWNFSPSESVDKFAADESLQEEITKEVHEFSWDFGNNWKRELQEDEILSVKPLLEDVVRHTIVEEPVEEEKEEEFPAWNFSEAELEEPIIAKDEIGTKTKIEEVDFSKLHEKLSKQPSGFEFEEVKAKDVTQELSIDLSDFERFTETEPAIEESESTVQIDEFLKNYDNPSDEEYVHVQSTSEFVLTQEQEKLLEEADPFSKFTVERTASEFDDSSSLGAWAEDAHNLTIEKTAEEDFSFAGEKQFEVEEEDKSPVEKEKGNKFWGFASAVLTIVIFTFLYWKMYGVPSWINGNETANQIVKTKPSVIEREYDVPVTYPYEVKITEAPKTEAIKETKSESAISTVSTPATDKLPPVKNDVDASDIFSKNNPRNRISGKTVQTQPQVQTSKPPAASVKEVPKKKEVVKEKPQETKKTTLVRDNIYLEGSTYVVQISSWKSESIADQEVARLKRKGIKAFKTSALVPQKGGTWYRVKVGGFSSIEEASQFYKSIK
ncbi:MAG: SPOR domain-containing protein [Ignavibacteria bacterium]|nr:SPOR domain-containing protein [Ignavibacteria bacterium]